MYDDALDAQIHAWYQNVLTDKSRKVWPPRNIPYFSPSAAGSCPRSLYEKALGAKKDVEVKPPHQGRWTRLGTQVGDMIQRDILFAEKHYAKATGQQPRFVFERNSYGEPMFEQFAPGLTQITHNGAVFALYGFCDGLMLYQTDDGDVLRVGLEIKSKQTTSAKTSEYSTRNGPDEKHIKQTVCYSRMYGVDYYVILYVNCAKKAWEMSAEDIAKTPDIKAYGLYITDEMRAEVFDGFADIVHAVNAKIPPPLDIENFTFNNFKRACALSLTEDEIAVIERKVSAISRSSLPDWKKRGPIEALTEIQRIRYEEEAKEAA
ncbi:hypothetical protein [Paenibacillus sp. FSL L8-0708]|uniref:hypothetical protein n=1 Tax=Paenibacillus sp. FSL L8-0708 TaxID=2975311 RepID=UPI0030F63236